jgi:hypothetical protein
LPSHKLKTHYEYGRLLHEAKPDSPYYNVLIGSADSDLPLPEQLIQVSRHLHQEHILWALTRLENSNNPNRTTLNLTKPNLDEPSQTVSQTASQTTKPQVKPQAKLQAKPKPNRKPSQASLTRPSPAQPSPAQPSPAQSKPSSVHTAQP